MPDKWFEKWFNTQDYLDLYKHRDARDAKKIVTLILKNLKLPKGSKVLDLACGNGRHSVLFAQKGFDVTGLDLSPLLINQAKSKLNTDYKKYKKHMRFVMGDMRNIPYNHEFDLIVNLFSSFGYFDKDSDNIKVIKSISAALKKGGYFFFDFLNANYLRKHLVPFDVKSGNHNMIIQVREITAGFVKKDIVIIKNSKNLKYPQIHNFYEKIKLYSLQDFRSFFRKNGLKILKTFGNYRGNKYNTKNSERLIILAQKQ
jgi:SAM-dependent methyltransferase